MVKAIMLCQDRLGTNTFREKRLEKGRLVSRSQVDICVISRHVEPNNLSVMEALDIGEA
jgi:hypothetical protein